MQEPPNARVNHLELTIGPSRRNPGHFQIEARIDAERMLNFDWYALDMPYGLLPSVERDGYWFIITCTCGIADCAGIEEAVEVRHGGGLVSWHIPEPWPPRDYLFDQAQYAEQVTRLVLEGQRIAAAHGWPDDNSSHKFVGYENGFFFHGMISPRHLQYWQDEFQRREEEKYKDPAAFARRLERERQRPPARWWVLVTSPLYWDIFSRVREFIFDREWRRRKGGPPGRP